MKEFLTEKELAQMGLKSRQALRNDRWLGRGIPYIKVGDRGVRYAKKDVQDWLQKNRVDPKALQ